MGTRNYGEPPTEEQELVIQQFLADHPVKFTLEREDGSLSYWMDRALRDERRRCVLREAETRFAHELMDQEEQQELLNRVKRLKRQLGFA